MNSISVVIPTYNRAHLLDAALESVFAQTFQPMEVIVVDDCSRDGTRELLEQWKTRNSLVRPFYHDVNRGAGGARQTGLDAAKGEFVAFLDSDDSWRKEHLAEGMRFSAANPQFDLVFGDLNRFSRDGTVSEEGYLWNRRRIGSHLRRLGGEDPAEWYIFEPSEARVLVQHYLVPLQTSIIRTPAARTISFDQSVRTCDDYDLMLRLALAGSRFGFIRHTCCDVLIHDGNLVSNGKALQLQAAREVATILQKHIHNVQIDAGCRRLLRRKIASLFFEEGYAIGSEGSGAAARQCYLHSFLMQPSGRALKALVKSTIMGPWRK